MSVRLDVLDRNLNLIAHLPRRRAVTWQDELNSPGMGSFQIHADDAALTADTNLLDYFNIVRVTVDGTARKAWVIEKKEKSSGDPADRWWTVSGRGALSLLSNAVVYPEYALKRSSADARSFDFGSIDGPWRVKSEWHKPLAIAQNNPASIRKRLPAKWPDPKAAWLWSTNPNAANANGINYFRGAFTLTTATRVTIYAAGDDNLILQLNGEPVMVRQYRQWRTPGAYTVALPAGTHLIAARVRNDQTTDALNSGAFLCSVARVDRNNKVLAWIKRSSSTSFICRGYQTRAPGWFAASILKKLVTEARTRGVEGLAPVTFGFTDLVDTAGAAWTGRQDRSFEIQRNLLEVVNKLTEVDIDVDMTPALQLRAWKTRGTDRRNTVRLLAGRDVTQETASANAAPVRTRSLTRHAGGWIEHVDAAAAAIYGRRETGLVTGNTSSDEQAATFSQAAFDDLGTPEVTLPITTTSEAGRQPYTDYDIGDTLTVPGILGVHAPARLMAITATEDENGLLTFDHDLYPEA